MNDFMCIKCNKQFTCNRNLKNHYNRKNNCCENNNINTSQNLTITHKTSQKKIENDDKKNICHYCNESFSRIDNLNRHINKFCKVKKEQEQEKEMIFKDLLLKEEQNNELKQHIIMLMNQNKLLLEQQQKKDEQIIDLIKEIKKPKINKSKCNIINSNSNNNNNISNNNTINNTVNIQIAQFGKENFNEIDKKHFEKIIRNPRILGVKVPEEILKMLHFNPDYPQFHPQFLYIFPEKYDKNLSI
jgi:hypothetical protein